MILLHGTTRRRAEQILARGPDPSFREPGGQATEDGFSMYLDYGPWQGEGVSRRRGACYHRIASAGCSRSKGRHGLVSAEPRACAV